MHYMQAVHFRTGIAIIQQSRPYTENKGVWTQAEWVWLDNSYLEDSK